MAASSTASSPDEGLADHPTSAREYGVQWRRSSAVWRTMEPSWRADGLCGPISISRRSRGAGASRFTGTAWKVRLDRSRIRCFPHPGSGPFLVAEKLAVRPCPGDRSGNRRSMGIVWELCGTSCSERPGPRRVELPSQSAPSRLRENCCLSTPGIPFRSSLDTTTLMEAWDLWQPPAMDRSICGENCRGTRLHLSRYCLEGIGAAICTSYGPRQPATPW